jgi:Leucine-rich repeat (LRR) protein
MKKIETFALLLIFCASINYTVAQQKTTFGFNSGYLKAAFNSEVDLYNTITDALQMPETVYAVKVTATTKNIADIKKLTNLKFLYFDETFTANSFYLSEEQIKVVFSILQQMPNLEYISCYDSQLLPYIMTLPHLKGLDLRQCDANIFNHYAKEMRELDILIIRDNKIQYAPSGIGYITTIRQLEMYCNSLLSFDPSFGNLQNVKVMKLQTGNVADLNFSFSNLQKLNYLKIWGTTSFLKFPSNIFEAGNLTELYLDIRTARPIPPEIDRLKNLRILYLMECQLVRNLGVGIGKMEKLETLYLSDADYMGNLDVLKTFGHPLKLHLVRCNLKWYAKELKDNANITFVFNRKEVTDSELNKVKEYLPDNRYSFE